MSAEASFPIELVSDPSPRTWKHWWRTWPKWFRIGCWAAIGLLVLHVAVAIRMAFGLTEAEEIAELRKDRDQFQMNYVWEKNGGPFFNAAHYEWHCLINAGLRGRSSANVVDIMFISGHEVRVTTDRDLQLIADHFPNVKNLWIGEADISADGVAKLRRCRCLEELDFCFSDIGDDAIEQLVELPCLTKLDLCLTQITDAVIPILRRMKSLKTVNLGSTDVTLAAIEQWRSEEGAKAPVISTDHRQELPELLRVSVRWSDGVEDRNFATPDRNSGTLSFQRISNAEKEKPYVLHLGIRNLAQMSISAKTLGYDYHSQFVAAFTDGHYRLTLDLAGCLSEPMDVEIRRDAPATQHLQFVMPVTREQAMEKWRRDHPPAGK